MAKEQNLEEFEQEDEREQLRRVAENLASQLRKAKSAKEELVSAVYRAANEAALITESPKVIKPRVDRRRKGEEVALIHCTDYQLGKKTESYDSDTCIERIDLFMQKVLSITEVQRADHPVKRAVLAFGGDMVEGVCIFPGQAHEVDSTLYTQLFRVVALMVSQVITLAANFEKVDVFPEYGNHGRLGKKGDYPAKDNMDLIAYRIAAEQTTYLPNVDWHLSENWYNMIEIGNYAALLIHGDEIKSFGGNTPAFGILRKVTAWSSGVVPGSWSDCYIGHFHQVMSLGLPRGGRVFMTPSTESGNEYAREFVAARGRPGQRLHFINPDKGEVTAEYVVWLDE